MKQILLISSFFPLAALSQFTQSISTGFGLNHPNVSIEAEVIFKAGPVIAGLQTIGNSNYPAHLIAAPFIGLIGTYKSDTGVKFATMAFARYDQPIITDKEVSDNLSGIGYGFRQYIGKGFIEISTNSNGAVSLRLGITFKSLHK